MIDSSSLSLEKRWIKNADKRGQTPFRVSFSGLSARYASRCLAANVSRVIVAEISDRCKIKSRRSERDDEREREMFEMPETTLPTCLGCRRLRCGVSRTRVDDRSDEFFSNDDRWIITTEITSERESTLSRGVSEIAKASWTERLTRTNARTRTRARVIESRFAVPRKAIDIVITPARPSRVSAFRESHQKASKRPIRRWPWSCCVM